VYPVQKAGDPSAWRGARCAWRLAKVISEPKFLGGKTIYRKRSIGAPLLNHPSIQEGSEKSLLFLVARVDRKRVPVRIASRSGKLRLYDCSNVTTLTVASIVNCRCHAEMLFVTYDGEGVEFKRRGEGASAVWVRRSQEQGRKLKDLEYIVNVQGMYLGTSIVQRISLG